MGFSDAAFYGWRSRFGGMEVADAARLRNLEAKAALRKYANRVADLRFFEHMLARLKAGEDMTRELAAFKKVDTKEAIKAVQQLIKACKDDLKLGYWDIKSKKIRTKVRTELISGELVPCYTVDYKVAIKSSEVSIRVETAGVTAEIYLNTKKCRAVSEDLAQDEVMKELVLAGLKGAL